MKSVNIIGAVFFDHRHDALPQAREDRRNGDRSHHADDDTEHREKAAKLMRTNTVQRHRQRFARKNIGKSNSHFGFLTCRYQYFELCTLNFEKTSKPEVQSTVLRRFS